MFIICSNNNVFSSKTYKGLVRSMRKIIKVFILCCVILVLLVGCGGKDGVKGSGVGNTKNNKIGVEESNKKTDTLNDKGKGVSWEDFSREDSLNVVVEDKKLDEDGEDANVNYDDILEDIPSAEGLDYIDVDEIDKLNEDKFLVVFMGKHCKACREYEVTLFMFQNKEGSVPVYLVETFQKEGNRSYLEGILGDELAVPYSVLYEKGKIVNKRKGNLKPSALEEFVGM